MTERSGRKKEAAARRLKTAGKGLFALSGLLALAELAASPRTSPDSLLCGVGAAAGILLLGWLDKTVLDALGRFFEKDRKC